MPTKENQPKLEAKEALIQINPQGLKEITPAGKEALKPIVTNTEDDVYAFSGTLAQQTIAAAMARLSRSPNDMRVTILDEFFDENSHKDEVLLERILGYGDDSVAQLGGVHIVCEGASNYLTKKLEWGRLGAYLEQSTRYIYFDQKDAQGQYKYLVPPEVKGNPNLETTYKATMDKIFDTYSEMVHQVTKHLRQQIDEPQDKGERRDWLNATRAQACDAIRGTLPVATKSTVGIFVSAQALENMIMKLSSDDLLEAQIVGQKILDETRKVAGVFLKRVDKADRGGATTAYFIETKQAMRALGLKYKQTPAPSNPQAELLSYNYEDELDLIVDMLYEDSNMSWKEIESLVNVLSNEERLNIFNTYIGERLNRRQKPGRSLEKLHYSWDIVCDYGIFRDLQRHRMVDDLNWQALTPDLGYQVPELVKEVGLENKWHSCFEKSAELFEILSTEVNQLVGQYAVLFAHNVRWKMTYNARQAFHLHELRTTPQGHPGYRWLINLMHDRISEIHPNLAAAIRFVNKDEDPELTRLAAERTNRLKKQTLAVDNSKLKK